MDPLPNTWDRFRRTKLVQWAVAYLAAAWLVMQLVEVLGGRWNWPLWIQRLIDLLLVVGFLAALVLAWYHGEQGRQRVSGPELVMIAALLAIAGLQIGVVRPDPGSDVMEASAPGVAGRTPATSAGRGAASTEVRLDLLLPDTASMAFVGQAPLGIGRQSIALSRTGEVVIYVASHGASTRLCRRALTRFDVECLAGTDGAVAPFLSRDGQRVAYFADGVLYTVPTSGGDPSPVAEVPNAVGGIWRGDSVLWSGREGSDVRIVSTIDGNGRDIPVDGPTVRSTPEMLPNGHVLYSNGANTYVTAGRTGHTRILLRNAQSPRFRPPSTLYFVRGADVMRVPFDADNVRIDGQPELVASGVRIESQGSGQYGISDSGTIVFAPGAASAAGRLHWVDGEGNRDPLPFQAEIMRHFRLSPDGDRIVAAVRGSSWDLWILHPETGTRGRITSEGDNLLPVWSQDGKWIFYRSARGDRDLLVRQRAEAGAEPVIVHSAHEAYTPLREFPGDSILGKSTPPGERRGFFLHHMDPRAAPRAAGPADDMSVTLSRLSPDRRWLAFTSSRLGRYEVYVTPWGRSAPRQLSTNGGEEPVWSRDGRSLYYRNGHDLMRIRLTAQEDGLLPGPTTRMWTMPGWINTPGHSYDITPDGARFLVLHRTPREGTDRLKVIYTSR